MSGDIDPESLTSFDALSLSEVDALSFSSRLAHINSDAARYFDAYRDARIDALESQFARRAMSRALARREAENNTLKSILRMHTLERNLRESEVVLNSAKEVESLLDDIAAKEARLKLFSETGTKTPPGVPPAATSARHPFVDDRDPNDPQRTAVKAATHAMCMTFGDQRKAIMYVHDNFGSLPSGVTPSSVIELLGSGVVQEQFEMVVREAEHVVSKRPDITYSDYSTFRAARNVAFDGVPTNMDKENVRAVILRQGFIEDVRERMRKGEDLTKPDAAPGWSRLPKEGAPEEEETTEKDIIEAKTAMEDMPTPEDTSANKSESAKEDGSRTLDEAQSFQAPCSPEGEDGLVYDSGSSEKKQATAPPDDATGTGTRQEQVEVRLVPLPVRHCSWPQLTLDTKWQQRTRQAQVYYPYRHVAESIQKATQKRDSSQTCIKGHPGPNALAKEDLRFIARGSQGR